MFCARSERGSLFAVNKFTDLPFIPRRFFIVCDVPTDCTRGEHAHWNSQQILFCLKGNIEITITDYSGVRTVRLGEGDKYFHNKLEWAKIAFDTPEAMMLSVCSMEFDEDDYICDFEEFKKIISLNQSAV